MTTDIGPGTIVGDRFELHERIDSGGLATVWRGTDLEADLPVGVKCENDATHDSVQVRAHFSQELHWFRRFATGPRPGTIVHFVDGAVTGDETYVVTELIEGGSIDGTLDDGPIDGGSINNGIIDGGSIDNGPIDGGSIDNETIECGWTPGLDAVARFAEPVCRAIEFLHRNGVVHLDLKPTNVLVRERGPPAIIDLNSAIGRDEETTTLFHHDPFKAPEVTPTELRDESVGPWSDVYASGKLLYFLLTGSSVGFDSSSLSMWHPVDPLADGADCSPELAAIVRRATEPRPDDRFVDAHELFAALAPVLGVPERTLTLVHSPTDTVLDVRPGDTLGRWSPDEPVATVVVPDAERYVSPVQATIERDDDGWFLRDRSLNGTFVRRSSGWTYSISKEGEQRRRSVDAALPVDDVESTIRLEDGDSIALVDPSFDPTLDVRINDSDD